MVKVWRTHIGGKWDVQSQKEKKKQQRKWTKLETIKFTSQPATFVCSPLSFLGYPFLVHISPIPLHLLHLIISYSGGGCWNPTPASLPCPLSPSYTFCPFLYGNHHPPLNYPSNGDVLLRTRRTTTTTTKVPPALLFYMWSQRREETQRDIEHF